MSEEHKIHVPLRGKHVQSAPIRYSARWYEEQGIELPPDNLRTRLRRTLARWLYRAGIELNRKERYLRLRRLSISWDGE